jgi:hypothetical protein
MMKRQWIGGSVLVAIGLAATLAGSAARAEGGRPSRQALQAMGLGSLVVMSDDEAMGVRGMGFMGGGNKGVQSYVRVTGSSFATYNGPNSDGSHSENSYFAEGKHDAKGTNLSYAGVADIWISSGKGGKDMGPKDKGPKDMGGNYGRMMPPKGDYGGMPGGNGYPGGDMNGHPGGGMPGGGYNVKIHATIFFAGGSSSAWAQ